MRSIKKKIIAFIRFKYAAQTARHGCVALSTETMAFTQMTIRFSDPIPQGKANRARAAPLKKN